MNALQAIIWAAIGLSGIIGLWSAEHPPKPRDTSPNPLSNTRGLDTSWDQANYARGTFNVEGP